MTIRRLVLTLLAALCIGALVPAAAHSRSIEDILGKTGGKIVKGAGIVLLTNVLSDQINDFINLVTFNQGVPTEADTKVVPIIAVGSGTRVGAAQVTGPRALVAKTKVVVQIETKFGAQNLDVEIFVPSDSMNPMKFNRVEGVGISALISLRLSGI